MDGVEQVAAPAGLNFVNPGTTWWLYAAGGLVPDVEIGYRLLVDSERIPLSPAGLREHAALLRSVGDALPALALDEFPELPDGRVGRLLTTSATLLARAGLLMRYREPAAYVSDMLANGIVILRVSPGH